MWNRSFGVKVLEMDHDHRGRDEGIPGLFNPHGYQLSAIKDYWKTNKYLHYSQIAERIPRDRFLDILR